MRTSDLPYRPQADRPATTQTISEKAYQLLRADIIAGSLQPGEKLRLQALQERYELGLSPIREALMLLCGEGLVSNEGQRGFSVSKLSRDDVLDLLHARTAIELPLLADAIEHGDDDWGANITAAYYKLTRARLPADASDTVAVELWEAAHRRFHLALVAAAKSKWLLRIDEQLLDHSERYRRIRLSSPGPGTKLAEDVQKEHLALMEAVLAGDTEKASALLRQHLMGTAEALSKRFAE